MRTVNRRRLLCFIVVAMMLITGMYSETIRIDSSFAYAVDEEAGAVITTLQDSFASQEMCTGEMLGIYRLDSTEAQIRCSGEKLAPRSRVRAGMILSAPEVLRESLLLTFPMTEAAQDSESSSKTVIISYIHHQDGSKG